MNSVRWRSILILGLALLALLVLAAPAGAAGDVGRLVVRGVLDTNGELVPESVCVSGPVAVCGGSGIGDGVATFVWLPAGDYTVDVGGYAGFSGLAQVTVRAGETTDVRVTVTSLFDPRITAYVSTALRYDAAGNLLDRVVPVRATLRSTLERPADAVQLHLTGPTGATLRDCYVSGPGDDPCRRGGTGQAEWFVGAMAPEARRGPFVAEYVLPPGPVSGFAGFAWISWQSAGRADAFTATIGAASPAPTPPPLAGSVVVLPMQDGLARAGVAVNLNGPTGVGGVTDSTGRLHMTGVPPGSYSMQLVGGDNRGFGRIVVVANQTTVARVGYLALPDVSGAQADGPLTVGRNAPRLLAFGSTTQRFDGAGRPIVGSLVTQVQMQNAPQYVGAPGFESTAIMLTGIELTVTPPASTAFRSCTPAPCRYGASRRGPSAAIWSGLSLDEYASSDHSTSWITGTASAGNSGPNTIGISWNEGGSTRGYIINLGAGTGPG